MGSDVFPVSYTHLGRTIPFEVTVPVKRGYIYFVRMGAKVKDSFEKHNYTEIVKVEVPQ